MERSPLAPDILFLIGPVPISRQVVTSWAIMAFLVLLSAAAFGFRRRPATAGEPGLLQSALELVVETLASQVEAVLRRDPWPHLPLLGTLFLFLATANLAAVIPGLTPPTSHLETPAALALTVLVAVHVEGFRARGLRGHLRHYLDPTPFMLPLHLVSEISRTFALAVRLFGNMMSHELVIAIILLLAGFLVPVPFLLMAILIGLIQAYIFTVLAAVFLAAALGEQARQPDGEEVAK